MTSNISGQTRHVDDGQLRDTVQSRIREKLAQMPRVDGQGHDLPSAPNAADVAVPANGDAPVSMLAALESVTAALNVNLRALVDSDRFVRRIGAIAPSDTIALVSLVSECLAANSALANSAPTSTPTATTTEQRIAQKIGLRPINQ
jgi:hypothetical protein